MGQSCLGDVSQGDSGGNKNQQDDRHSRMMDTNQQEYWKQQERGTSPRLQIDEEGSGDVALIVRLVEEDVLPIATLRVRSKNWYRVYSKHE